MLTKQELDGLTFCKTCKDKEVCGMNSEWALQDNELFYKERGVDISVIISKCPFYKEAK